MKLDIKSLVWAAFRERRSILKMPHDWTTLLQWLTICWVMRASAMAGVNRPWETIKGSKI